MSRPVTAPRRPAGSFAVDARPLRIPAFRRLWLASVVTSIGGSFSVVAVPAQLFALTGSSASIAAAATVSCVALIVACLVGGALADRLDRRRVLLAAQGVQALTYLLLWAQAALQVRSVGVLLALTAGQGLSLGAVMTTTGAVVPRVVPAELLPAAASLSSLVRYTGAIVGPLLAGALLPVTGLAPLYLCDATALLLALGAVTGLPSMAPAPVTSRPPGSRTARSRPTAGHLARHVVEGFAHLTRQPILVAVLGVDLIAMVCGSPVALFPELAERTFSGPRGGGPGLGLLYAAYPVGVVAMGLLSGTVTRSCRHGALLVSAGIVWGLSVTALGLAPGLGAAVGLLVLGGAANMVLSTFRNAITQVHLDDALRGRAQGALTVVLVGGPQAGSVLHAGLGAVLGPRAAICLGGIATSALIGGIGRWAPRLWGYRASTHADDDGDRDAAGQGAGPRALKDTGSS